MEPKELNYKEVLKSNIILFLSYSILIGFIFLLVCICIKVTIRDVSSPILSILLSLIGGILLYHILHFICKSSTFESLKKVRLDNENSHHFMKKMNLFFMICVIFSVLICIGYLLIDNFLYASAINQAYEQYDFISHDLAQRIADTIYNSHQSAFLSKLSSSIIIELSLVISFFSLIPYQRNLILKYNK